MQFAGVSSPKERVANFTVLRSLLMEKMLYSSIMKTPRIQIPAANTQGFGICAIAAVVECSARMMGAEDAALWACIPNSAGSAADAWKVGSVA